MPEEEFSVSHNALRTNYIDLSGRNCGSAVILTMEVIESESSVLKKDQLIVLYCIEEVERNYVFNTANSSTLRGRIAHTSFIEKLEERRMILL